MVNLATHRELVTQRIDRTTKWGNPYVLGRDGDRDRVIELYRTWIHHPHQAELKAAIIQELKGEVLGCWCTPKPCHGDILAEIADGDDDGKT